ncbi:hypothetical protein NM688_g6101 [Phlebia brevispora]|uniref:Uncharacterized protein n=1 Tax=Phlebia brevispora TaxID=194682 RepID=A0ACC1SJR1_9APHY|nr:hypothetical protein NM688_g6101 [Phlebia brevispora]
MLKTASRTLKLAAPLAQRRLLSQTTSGPARVHRASRQQYAQLIGSAALAAGIVWYATREQIHNDASEAPSLPASPAGVDKETAVRGVSPIDGSLATLVWGSNKTHLLASDDHVPESVRTPAVADWLKDVALRDLVLHEQHAACIDAKGDVYQWGDGFFSAQGPKASTSTSGKPVLTLRGKNITKLQATHDRVFALSASGRIYVLSANMAQQALPAGAPTPASTPWWGTGWMWGEEEQIEFAEITPHEKLNRREKFVSIAAGNNHLLALTSSGRTFAHPINTKANAYGQLGFRKFDIPDRSASTSHPRPHLHHARQNVELTPKIVSDPYANASPASRPTAIPEADQALATGDSDGNIHWSDRLFEIPSLKGVKVEQVAAGSRSSYARTEHGRVLGWGANEFGQIGLGGNVSLTAITVPTEIILWRSTPQTMRTTCLDVYAGGDLTFFKVERTDGSAMPYIDVLACGNGQYGGLGSAAYSNAQSTPVRAKNVSGLLEYSEKTNNLQPIYPHDISISPTGHVLLTLDTLARSGPGGGGRDLLVWGLNQEYQLGNGKRGSIASPMILHAPDGQRFMLGRRTADIKDLSGKLWRKGVQVEQFLDYLELFVLKTRSTSAMASAAGSRDLRAPPSLPHILSHQAGSSEEAHFSSTESYTTLSDGSSEDDEIMKTSQMMTTTSSSVALHSPAAIQSLPSGISSLSASDLESQTGTSSPDGLSDVFSRLQVEEDPAADAARPVSQATARRRRRARGSNATLSVQSPASTPSKPTKRKKKATPATSTAAQPATPTKAAKRKSKKTKAKQTLFTPAQPAKTTGASKMQSVSNVSAAEAQETAASASVSFYQDAVQYISTYVHTGN